jgi:hypothetical protein
MQASLKNISTSKKNCERRICVKNKFHNEIHFYIQAEDQQPEAVFTIAAKNNCFQH